jgi:hypothetical protein
VHIPAVDGAAKPLRVGDNLHSSDGGEVILRIVNDWWVIAFRIHRRRRRIGTTAASTSPYRYHGGQHFTVDGTRHHVQADGVTDPRSG